MADISSFNNIQIPPQLQQPSADAQARGAISDAVSQGLRGIQNQQFINPNAIKNADAVRASSAQINPALMAQRQKFAQAQMDDTNRQGIAAQQNSEDAIQRRFASMGMQNSGAALGAQAEANRGIDAQMLAQKNALGAQQSAADASMAENQAGRDQASEEANAGRAQAANQFGTQNATQMAEFNSQLQAAQNQGLIDAGTTFFNQQLASQEANRKPLGLLGQGGFLGTGIGAK